MTDEEFAKLAGEAMDALPDAHLRAMQNVAVVYADEPTPEQRKKLALLHNQTLFGLYEGIPQIKRGAGYNMVLPDKITIFKFPLMAASRDVNELRENIRHTLWHEIAHHFAPVPTGPHGTRSPGHHGPAFVAAYLDLIEHVMNKEAANVFRECFVAEGISVQ